MARPAKPAHLKEVQGSYKKHPERRNGNQPEPTRGIGPAPKHFDQLHSDIWDEIVSLCYPGVLGEADRIALEMMCNLLHTLRHDKENATQAAYTRLHSMLGSFGMTPADRQKVSIPKASPKNPFEDF